MTELILGTANLGMAYGVSNQGTLLAEAEAEKIINHAQRLGFRRFDTASAYFMSEILLGKYLNKNLSPSVDAKIQEKNCKSVTSIVESTENILAKLKISRLSILYLHSEEVLFGENRNSVIHGLEEVLRLGLADRVGVSVYSEKSIIEAREIMPKLTAFQVPENICDRRLINSKSLKKLATLDCIFIVRSIFLQGLLQMDPQALPEALKPAQNSIVELRKIANANSMSITDLCLAYAESIEWASGIIVGVASVNQLEQISMSDRELPECWDSQVRPLPEEILDPRYWNL